MRARRFGIGAVAAFTSRNLQLGYRTNKIGLKRLKARRYIGETQNKPGLTKISDTEFNNISLTTKTLYRSQRLLNLPLITDEAQRNGRLRNSVKFKGIKLCVRASLKNVTGRDGDKLFFNWAIVSPKQLDPLTTTLPDEEFFRSQGGAARSETFSTNLSGLDLRCLPINTDKYIIHRHKRMIVGPYESTEGKAEKYFEEWLPVRRKVVYNTTGTSTEQTYPEGKDMWMVYWVSYMNEEPLTLGVADAVDLDYRIVRYFRDLCC